MRHLWSLLAGVIAAPLTWLFLATGQHRSEHVVQRWDEAARFDTADLIAPAAFLAVAGILLGLLGTLRWSPAGPVAAGLLFVLPTVLMFINPFRTLDGFLRPDDGSSRRFLAQDLEPWLPVSNGTLLVIGSLLLMAVFSAQRWRRWPTQPAPIPPATDQEVVAGISALTSPPSTEPSTEPAATPQAGTGAPTGESMAGSGGEARAAMTDDEILAAAAAFEAQERARTSAEDRSDPEPPDSGQPDRGDRGA